MSAAPLPKIPNPFTLADKAIPRGIVVTKVTTIAKWLELRERDVTASAAGVLFGDSGAHGSAMKLWAEKSGLVEPEKQNRAMRRGQIMEPGILTMLQEEYPSWQIVQAERYYSDPLNRVGATPDFFAIDPDRPGFGVIDAKSIGMFAPKEKWKDADGEATVPLWIAIQLNITAALCGASWGAVSPYHMGEDWIKPLVDVPLIASVMPTLHKLVKDFWRRVKEGQSYPPDYNKDAKLIGELYDGEGGPLLDLGDAPEIAKLLDDREALKAREADGAAATKARKPIDAELIARLGNASGARLSDGRTFSVKITRRKGFTVEPTQYPQLTVKAA